jgi:NAD(P)-dependent dehydrogenase (short-subunit alcohol dehydrogenase family)
MKRLKDKVALITGVDNDVGYETARRFVEEDVKVVAMEIRLDDRKRGYTR